MATLTPQERTALINDLKTRLQNSAGQFTLNDIEAINAAVRQAFPNKEFSLAAVFKGTSYDVYVNGNLVTTKVFA